MSSALGISSSRSNSGLRPADIRDFGAVPGDSNAALTRMAIQAAIDSVPLDAAQPRTVFVPAAEEPWVIDRPVWLDRSNLCLRGDPDGGSRIEMAWHNHSACVLVGMPRVALGQSLSAEHFVDLYGRLDRSAAPEPGRRRGIRTNGSAHVAQGAGPLSYGPSNFGPPDYWGKTRRLCVEFATDLTLTPVGSLDRIWFGLSDKGEPQPFVLVCQNGSMIVDFATSDGKRRRFTFAPPSGDGVTRIAFQIDLEARAVSAYIDGVQVAVDGYGLGDDFARSPGLSFATNRNVPFKFASTAFGANNYASDYYPTPPSNDLSLYGLRISNAVRYVADSPGTPQRRIDGREIDDHASYFDLDMQTVALFPFQDDPAQAAKDRFLTVQTVAGQSAALYLSKGHGSPYSSIGGNRLRDLSITSHDQAYGEALNIGYALYLRVENCTLHGGAHGIGSWNWGANYVTRIRDCEVYGGDAAIYNNYGMMEVDGLFVPAHGRSTFWISAGRLRGRNIFCGYGGEPEYIVRSTRGSDVHLENFSVDIEGGPYPSKGGFYAESSSENGGTSGGRLRLKDVNFGTIGRDTPLVVLAQSRDYDPPAQFELDGLVLVGEEYKSLVDTRSKNWTGTMKGIQCDPVFPPITNDPGCGGAVSIHDSMTGSPRAGRWETGSHVLEVRSPAPGQFSRWRCASGGEYGTSTPPKWHGFEPLDDGGNALAAYVCGHSCWTAGPGTRTGFWTDEVHALLLNHVFGGAPLPGRSPLYLGLSTYGASRTGYYQECDGPGYARIPVGSFDVGGDGSLGTAQALAFPTAGADWTGLRSLFLTDAPAGGNVVAMIGLEPFAVAQASSFALDAGALRVQTTVQGDSFAVSAFRRVHESISGGSAGTGSGLHVALSINDADPSAAPVEPSDNGYSRVAAPASSWTKAQGSPAYRLHQRGTVTNAVPLHFGTPSGLWGEIRSIYLMDAPEGGNVVAAANLSVMRRPDAGRPAPAFATGALRVSLC